MKKLYLLFAIIIVAAGAFFLSARGRQGGDLPDLSGLGKITVIAREEGSGTKEAYRLLVNTSEKGVNKIAASTNQVMELTSEDENAIGYMASSSLSEVSKVKALSVNGIPADRENIANGKYPLRRQYILAYKGDLSELETDFLAYVHSAGQKIAADFCTPVSKAAVFLSNKAKGRIRISGSSSAAPLMEQLVQDYGNYNPNAEITIEVSDSSAGLNAALRGDCDLAMSSRPLKEYEAELLETVPVAADGVAVIVNEANPLTGLSMKQIKSIYDGDAVSWSDLK